MSAQEIIVDFSSPDSKARLWSFLRSCEGKWRITACRHRKRRSDAQNAYYHGVVVKLFAEFLREQGDIKNAELAHEILKAAHLQIPVVGKDGELVCMRTGSTKKLSTPEFIEYIERCIHWLADMFHIVVPDPNEYAMN